MMSQTEKQGSSLRPGDIAGDLPAPPGFARYGAAFGLLFPVLAMLLLIAMRDLPLTLATFIRLQRTEPLLWIIDTAPFFLGLMAALAGRREARLREAYHHSNLQKIINSLEQRIADRTRDLAFASEVGRRLAAIREHDTLLAEAVELIGDRFALYHTQIYLVDDARRNLILLASSGAVGRELLRRGHRLAIGPGSINGQAALSQQTIVVPDTSASPFFRPNLLLPNTRSEMAVPLVVDDRVVGVLNLQHDQPGSLTADHKAAFELLAGQLAIAIRNAELFREISVTQAAVQRQARQLADTAWQEYLDAAGRPEEISYAYESETIPADAEMRQWTTPIALGNASLGSIELLGATEDDLTADQHAVVTAVAQQVAQQIENLRLLGEAERYRAEAEQAVRRLTREGWAEFQASESAPAGYWYDGRQLELLDAGADRLTAGHRQPLTVQGETIGQLVVAQEQLSPEAQTLVAAVAERLSSQIENLRLNRQTERALADAQSRNEELALINRVVAAVSTSLNLGDSMQIIAHELAEALQVDQVGIALLDEDRAYLTVVAEHYDVERSPSALGFVIPVEGNESTQLVLATRRPLVIDDPQNDPIIAPVHEGMRMRGVQCLTILPMIIGNDVIGTVGIDILEEGRMLSEAQTRLAETLIYQAATAVQNARLFDQLQQALTEAGQQAHRLALLNELSEQLNLAGNLQEIFAHAVAMADRLLSCDRVTLVLLDEAQEDLVVAAQAGAHPLKPDSEHHQVTGSLVERAILHGDVIIVQDDEPDPGREISSAMIVPLVTSRGAIGTLNVGSQEMHAYTDREASLMQQLASLLSSAIENRRLFEQMEQALAETEDHSRRLMALNEMSAALNRAETLDDVFRIAVEYTPRVLPADRVSLPLLDESGETFTVAAVWGDESVAVPGTQVALAGSPMAQAMDENRVVRGTTDGPIKSAMIVPLFTGGRIIGTLNVGRREPEAFSVRDENLLPQIASLIGASIENKRLLHQAQTRARRERLLREITAQVRSGTDMETIMRTAVRQVGQALGREAFVYLNPPNGGHAPVEEEE